METIGEKLANHYIENAPESSDKYAYTVGVLSAKIDILMIDIKSAINEFKENNYHKTALYFERLIEKFENVK